MFGHGHLLPEIRPSPTTHFDAERTSWRGKLVLDMYGLDLTARLIILFASTRTTSSMPIDGFIRQRKGPT